MLPITEAALRASFINVTRSERTRMTLPDLAAVRWNKIEYLGWTDPKSPLQASVVIPVDDEVVGILLRRNDAKPRNRPQCAWCSDITLRNDVVMFAARRAGSAGRRGDTVGTLVCENFGCSAAVRMPPPSAYLDADPKAAIEARIDMLRTRVAGFARELRDHQG